MLNKLTTVVRQQAFGLLALFVALGGTSYAVATGSIDSREIKNNSIRSKDIRNGQVASADVRNGSLMTSDFARGQLPTGPAGPQGLRGLPGAKGNPGAPGASVTSADLAEGNTNCPAGGSSFTSSSGTTYACNGSDGSDAASPLMSRVTLPAYGPAPLAEFRWAPVVGLSTTTPTGPDGDGPVWMLSPPVDTVARDLTVRLTQAPGVGTSREVNLTINGQYSLVGCGMSSGATECSNTVGRADVPANARLSLVVRTFAVDAPAAATSMAATFRLTAP